MSKRKRKKDQVVLKSAHVNCKVLDTVHNNLTIVITFFIFKRYVCFISTNCQLTKWCTP